MSEQILKPDPTGRLRSFIFGDEHEQLRETIEAFAKRELAPHAEEWEETTFPDSVFRRMGELGFLGLDKPEEYGGQGGDYFAAIVLAEALVHARSAGLALGVAVQTDMAMPPILAFGSEEQKREWLAPAIAGEKILSLGITEPGAGSDVAGIRTRAVADGDGFRINGAKTYITNGSRADGIVLVTKTDPEAGYGGFTLFIVPLGAEGVVRERTLRKLGNHASDTAQLAFEDVWVPREAVLGTVGRGFYDIMWELQGERVIGAAGAVASAQLAFDRTLEFARERVAFGRPIGRFQAIRHRFAEMSAKIDAARSLVHATAWRFRNGEYPVREISAAKLVACRTNVEVCDECIQIHGGAGYMREYGIERMWRDARLGRIGGGTDEVMLEVIAGSYDL
jgi:alkylation response protein AidB-like acyl-CoA dehydrogenase